MAASFSFSSEQLAENYQSVRQCTERLCAPLEIEDYQLQSMSDCSPPKWHLAHTTWFFETFLLAAHRENYRPYHPQFGFLYNSYYEAVGARWPRPARGLLTRPTVREIYAYRHAVDQQVLEFLDALETEKLPSIVPLVELGLNHEQQHQELLLTDLKHAFGLNPLQPVYVPPPEKRRGEPPSRRWLEFPAAIRDIGHAGGGFAFDNEAPRHKEYVPAFAISSRLASVGEYREFMQAGGYTHPEFWLSDGWAACKQQNWQAPLYWHADDQEQTLFTLHGSQPLDPSEPVCHLSFYEADAFARWSGARLPTEAEWETAAQDAPLAGHFLDTGCYHPRGHGGFYGDVWVWTASPYVAYPGYRPATGALGEYNGKFMCNQLVLRGGSCATPAGHVRPTYRNFFPPDARWQFSGLRLAKDLPQ